jgi:hypothetical protein
MGGIVSKNFDRFSGYDVGYRKPPTATRFSSTNQPTRPPRRLPPRPKTTMIELGQEQMRARQPDGAYVELTGDELMMETLIAKALKGDINAARDLYQHLDREEDAWMERPRYTVDQQRLKKLEAALKEVTNVPLAARRQLEALGIIQRIQGNEFCISPWVKKAFQLHQHQESVAAGQHLRGS